VDPLAPSPCSLRAETISLDEYSGWFRSEYAGLRHRSPYHHPAWLAAAALGTGYDLAIVGVRQGSDLVAAVPGFVSRRGPFRFFGSPLRGAMTSYLGPVAAEPRLLGEDLPELVELCRRHIRSNWRSNYIRFALRDERAELPDLGREWRRQRAWTYRLDLSGGTDALWAGLKSDCRRNIRRAEREGIEVVPFDDAELYYRMITATFERHGATSWQRRGFFRALIDGIPSPDPLLCVGARLRGETIAAGLFLRDDAEIHFVSGASLPKHGSLPTSYLLHWHAISAAADAGVGVFGSDASQVRAIDRFKESFGPVLVRRCSLIWTPRHVRRAERMFMRWRTRRKRKGARRHLDARSRPVTAARAGS
jgi:hypothetical protein